MRSPHVDETIVLAQSLCNQLREVVQQLHLLPGAMCLNGRDHITLIVAKRAYQELTFRGVSCVASEPVGEGVQ